jgi:hypothetical protein
MHLIQGQTILGCRTAGRLDLVVNGPNCTTDHVGCRGGRRRDRRNSRYGGWFILGYDRLYVRLSLFRFTCLFGRWRCWTIVRFVIGRLRTC